MPRYIDLDKLNEYPIRLNHNDKENGKVNFVYGIESVLEYANSLPVFETEITQKPRYIDAEKLKQKIIEGDGDDEFVEGYNFAINEIREYIDNAPTADVQEVKHGHWIFKEYDVLIPTGEIAITEGHIFTLDHSRTIKPNTPNIIYLKEHKKIRKPFCSICGEYGDDESDATPFCPNCGAKMDGGEQDNETYI